MAISYNEVDEQVTRVDEDEDEEMYIPNEEVSVSTGLLLEPLSDDEMQYDPHCVSDDDDVGGESDRLNTKARNTPLTHDNDTARGGDETGEASAGSGLNSRRIEEKLGRLEEMCAQLAKTCESISSQLAHKTVSDTPQHIHKKTKKSEQSKHIQVFRTGVSVVRSAKPELAVSASKTCNEAHGHRRSKRHPPH